MDVYSDIPKLVEQIESYVGKRGASLGLNSRRLVSQIIGYIYLRQQSSWLDITDPQMSVVKPPGWTDRHEKLWTDWIHYTFTPGNWEHEVMLPLFGSDIRAWEMNMGGWRDELLHYLPWWVLRSVSIVEEYDPTSVDPEEEDEGQTSIDPYILDHRR